MTLTKQDCIDALQEAYAQLGHSPTMEEYRNLDISPASCTIEKKHGTWNNAKEAAGLEVIERSHDVDEDFFSVIDDAETAYWLGFLWGDGFWSPGFTDHPCIGLRLAEKDRDHLKLFRNTISSEHPIKVMQGRPQIRIGNGEFIRNLKDKGLTPTKCYDGSMPVTSSGDELSGLHRRHWIRGLHDADGHLDGENHRIRFTGQPNRIQKLSTWIPNRIDSHIHNGSRGSTQVLTISEDIGEVSQFIYPDGRETEPKMERKTPDICWDEK